MDNGFYYVLNGGPSDGETGFVDTEEGVGMYDNLSFLHPTLHDLCTHYKFESMEIPETGNMEITYTFVREFPANNHDEYMKHMALDIGAFE